jgi:arylsulfatase
VIAALLLPLLLQVPTRPNVVLIVADDLGYGELGCYGQVKIATPHLDRLAAEGLRFTQFYAGAPVCAPSRCVLLTGLHTGHAFVRDNVEVQPEGQLALPAGTFTLARALDSAGYATGLVGKWGLGAPGSSGTPEKQGFDEWFGYLCQRQAHSFYPTHLWKNGERVELAGNALGATAGREHAQPLLAAEALAFLERHRAEPFFLYVPFTLPHLALQPQKRDLAEYRDKFPETPYDGRNGYMPHSTPRAAYAAMVSRLDADVGRLVAKLDELGLAQETLVLFTSDNGPTHDVGGVDTEFFASTAGLRGRKGSVYEGGLRVPLIARWPGMVPAGKSCAQVAGFQDVLPTVLELAGVATPPGLDGKSFAATLRDGEPRPRTTLTWEFHGYGQQLAARRGDWKLVQRELAKGGRAPELYDLAADPSEVRDVAHEHPELVSELLAEVRAAHRPSAEFPIPFLDPEPSPAKK